MTTKHNQQILQEWVDSGKHLPKWLRAFYDQKNVFQAIDQTWSRVAGVNYVQGHCYVIDRFLYYMAAHGYTLQKSRAKIPFANLATAVQVTAKK